MRYIFIICFLVLLSFLPVGAVNLSAENALFSLTKDVNYDVTVQLSDGILSKIKNIYVVGTVEIKDKAFLVAELQNDVKRAVCLIALDSIKTIVPSNSSQESLVSEASLK